MSEIVADSMTPGRPREGGDHSAAGVRKPESGEFCLNQLAQGLWVPAFAGTTTGVCGEATP